MYSLVAVKYYCNIIEYKTASVLCFTNSVLQSKLVLLCAYSKLSCSKMQLLYWPVIVLSVSVANVVSESQVGGLTARTIYQTLLFDLSKSGSETRCTMPLT